MKHKYVISKNDKKGTLIIKEFGGTEKGIMPLLSEETYDSNQIKELITKEEKDLFAAIRTKSFYLPFSYMLQLTAAISQLYASDDKTLTELFIDDKDALATIEKNEVEDEVKSMDDDVAEEISELDKLLGDENETLKKDTINIEDEENPKNI